MGRKQMESGALSAQDNRVSHRHPDDGLPLIGSLPRAFLVVGFVNFIVGASLGGWMAADQSVWGLIGQVHGEINPFGWLTMLIYGMTYAVLAVSAGLRPPKAWVGWLQLAFAELGVGVVVSGLLLPSLSLVRIGLVLQFAAPVVFLVNILSAVASRRRTNLNDSQVFHAEHPLSVLERGDVYKATDRVGQRGTDVSLMLFLLGAGWMAVRVFAPEGQLPSDMPAALLLVYYGWIAGTVFAVALHLFPRFTGRAAGSHRAMTVAQGVWGGAVVVGAVGLAWSPALADWGARLLGVPFLWFGAVYLNTLWKSRPIGRTLLRVPRESQALWLAAWVFCFVLGLLVLFGLDPLSLVALHLLFLGFATNLVYGIGYTLFPHILGRRPPRPVASGLQSAGAILGSVMMVVAFSDMQLAHPVGAMGLLAVGGTLAGLSALGFIFLWLFTKPT